MDRSGLTFGDDYQIGKTKMFLRPATFTRLEVIKGEMVKGSVVKIQRFILRALHYRRVVRKRKAVLRLQAFFRGYKVRCEFYEFRKNKKYARVIQRYVRGFLIRQKYDPIFVARADAAWVIHRAFRTNIMKRRLRAMYEGGLRNRAAEKLQSLARVMKAQKRANNLYVEKVTGLAANSIQGLARMMKAKKARKQLWEKKLKNTNFPEGAQFIWWIPPLVIIFLLSNPIILLMMGVLAGSMALGSGAVLDYQRQNEEVEKRKKYLQAYVEKQKKAYVPINVQRRRRTSTMMDRHAMRLDQI